MLTKRDHQIICEDLSTVLRERKERQRREIELLSTPTISDKLLAYGMAAVALTGVVLILIYIHN